MSVKSQIHATILEQHSAVVLHLGVTLTMHRRRKRGGRGATRPPPKFKVGGGGHPPNCLSYNNELHWSIVIFQTLFLVCVF